MKQPPPLSLVTVSSVAPQGVRWAKRGPLDHPIDACVPLSNLTGKVVFAPATARNAGVAFAQLKQDMAAFKRGDENAETVLREKFSADPVLFCNIANAASSSALKEFGEGLLLGLIAYVDLRFTTPIMATAAMFASIGAVLVAGNSLVKFLRNGHFFSKVEEALSSLGIRT